MWALPVLWVMAFLACTALGRVVGTLARRGRHSLFDQFWRVSASPCTPEPLPELALRRAPDLAAGFVTARLARRMSGCRR